MKTCTSRAALVSDKAGELEATITNRIRALGGGGGGTQAAVLLQPSSSTRYLLRAQLWHCLVQGMGSAPPVKSQGTDFPTPEGHLGGHLPHKVLIPARIAAQCQH